MIRLTVSVVVGAEPELVLACLESLRAACTPAPGAGGAPQLHVELRVTCDVPNPLLAASLATRFPGVQIVENSFSQGFAANHNRALYRAAADYYLIANDDLEFDPGSVVRCLEFLQHPDNGRVAALTPRLLNTDRTLQRSTYRFPTVPRALLDLAGLRAWIPHNRLTDAVAVLLGRGAGRSRFWRHDRTCDVDTFRGAAMFVRADAWRAVGPFSELTRVGGETAEWHRRCHDRGYRVVFFADASVVHHGSRTVGRDPLLASEYLKGYLAYFALHRHRAVALAFRMGALVIASFRLSLAALAGSGVGKQLWRTNLAHVLRPPRAAQ